MIIGNLKLEEYFEVLYPLLVVDILRTSNVHQCLFLVSIGYPLATINLVGDNREIEVRGIF